ncbi:MAG: hypothetical protein OQK27_02475 [Gammaproteobacteria bacterium]|nr:hypothetical protein [Gammaproteobacteria bacterium]
MISALKKSIATGILLAGSVGVAMAADALKPFVLAYTTGGDIEQVAGDVKEKLGTAGFEIAGSYSPYEGALILAITNDTLKQAAASSEFGGYAAGQRVTLTKVEDEIQVSYTNPLYYGTAYRLKETEGLNQVASALQTALGKTDTFGTGEKQLSDNDLRKYRYMFGMERFNNPSELANYKSYDEAIAAVEQGLNTGAGGASKVYRIDIPGKQETVFGVALTDGCSGDEYIMSRIDRDNLRSTGHLPYEILVSGGDVYALYARFRIAISWPHLPMIASETGATFFNIMCAPNAIEESLIKAAGGRV